MVKIDKFKIYGSGDPGSAELKKIFTKRKIPFKFMDIREDSRRIETLTTKNLTSVPQVFDLKGVYVGNFEQTVEYLDSQNKVIEQVTMIS